MKVEKKYMYVTATVIWGLPGIMITLRGIATYAIQPLSSVWWMMLITLVVILFFYYIFNKVVTRYIGHIASLSTPTSIVKTFSLRGWLLIIFMMGLGITLRSIPDVPAVFTATFYAGLGPMLIMSAVRFLQAAHEKGASGNPHEQ